MGVNFSALLGGPSRSLARGADIRLTERLRREQEEAEFARQQKLRDDEKQFQILLEIARGGGEIPAGAPEGIRQIGDLSRLEKERSQSNEDDLMRLERLLKTQNLKIGEMHGEAAKTNAATAEANQELREELAPLQKQTELLRQQSLLNKPDKGDTRYFQGVDGQTYYVTEDPSGKPTGPAQVLTTEGGKPLVQAPSGSRAKTRLSPSESIKLRQELADETEKVVHEARLQHEQDNLDDTNEATRWLEVYAQNRKSYEKIALERLLAQNEDINKLVESAGLLDIDPSASVSLVQEGDDVARELGLSIDPRFKANPD